MEIGVLVVDDSALMRNLVSRIVNAAPDLTVVGTAMNGEFALSKIPRLKPDIIVLDIEMPVMTGIEFLQEREKRGIDIPVIILSSIAQKGAKVTMEALAHGASDFITKPSGAISQDIHIVGNQLVALLRGYGGKYRRMRGLEVPPAPDDDGAFVPQTRGDSTPPAAAHSVPDAHEDGVATVDRPIQKKPAVVVERKKPKSEPGPLELIVLGISTGGPNALRKVFTDIDGDIGVPIVVVQHMPAGFTTEFARSLDRVSSLEVKEAADGDILKPGRVLIAPGDYHIAVERRKLAGIAHLNHDAPCNGHRPSAGVLFQSAAKHYGNKVMAVIMTGMGRDGSFEIGEIYEAGGVTLGQDEPSSVVYGMPRVAFESGHLHRQVSLDEMAKEINETAKTLKA